MDTGDLAALLGIPGLPADLRQIERALEDAVGSDNSYLAEPGMRVVKAPGKRLRPVLTIAAAASGGVGLNGDVVAGAVSVELVHAGSLVHDDIIDEALLRRGVATVNSKEGVDHAVLVGDYLLARSGEAAASVSKEVAGVLATTIVDLCDGQSRETADGFNVDRTLDNFLAAIAGKTAALMRSSCRIGAMCARLPPAHVGALTDYGTNFGMAFQLVDDVLDIVSTAEALKKPVGNDVREGVYTMPILLALQGSYGEELRPMLGGPIDDPADLAAILDLVKAAGTVDQTLEVAQGYNAKAAGALAGLEQNEVTQGLARLPGSYLDWALARHNGGGCALPG